MVKRTPMTLCKEFKRSWLFDFILYASGFLEKVWQSIHFFCQLNECTLNHHWKL
jgi:hypothetical protein